jgi:hypothetical protein
MPDNFVRLAEPDPSANPFAAIENGSFDFERETKGEAAADNVKPKNPSEG